MKPIGCDGVAVYSGHIVVGDAQGGCTPRAIADAVAIEACEQTIYEDQVAQRINAGEELFGVYPLSDPDDHAKYAAWRSCAADHYPLAVN